MRELSSEEVQDVSGGWTDQDGTLEFFVSIAQSIFDAVFGSGPSAVDIAVTTPSASNGP